MDGDTKAIYIYICRIEYVLHIYAYAFRAFSEEGEMSLVKQKRSHKHLTRDQSAL